jgi:FtsK/SpoIIIE family
MVMHEDLRMKDVLMGVGGAIPLFVPLELLGQGPAALILGVVGGVVTCVYHEEMAEFLRHRAPALQDTQGLKKWLLSRPGEEAQPKTENPAAPDVFQVAATQERQSSGVQRLTIRQIVEHTQPNSFRIPFGRSLTQAGNPVVSMNFYKKHIKLIGASQKGKSSMAAALLKIITATHAPSHVLVALMDKEDRTSKLFAHLPHIAEVLVDDKPVLLHARTDEQVLEYLGYIVTIVRQRYTLTEAEKAALPILLVYLEEFIALKDYFKMRVSLVPDAEKEQARKDYAKLVYCIKEIARMGLKARVQLLMCAQVDYRDEDLQEALINVTAGMSFCVRASSAQAAGFMRADLLNRNARENVVGQAVVEMPECSDLVLAPECNLDHLMLRFEQAEAAATAWQQTRKLDDQPAFVTAANGHRSVPSSNAHAYHAEAMQEGEPLPMIPQQPASPTARFTPTLSPELQKALDVYRPGMNYREFGAALGVSKDTAGKYLQQLRDRRLIDAS